MAVDNLDREQRPATSYAEACSRFDELLGQDTDAVDPQSRSRLISPGDRTQRAIVLFHGLTNSPQQFLRLAERFTADQYTVLIPRVPYHGYTDRMSTEQARLSVKELVDTAAATIDLAAGLAEEVTVSGISMGGVLAVWAAQYRPVHMAAPIAPAIGLPKMPVSLTSPVFDTVGKLPNRFVWWDPRVKEALPGPTYAYPRFATHALVETQRLGMGLVDAARRAPPRAARVWMISNAADLAVSNAAGDLLVKRWRASGATQVRTYQFPRQLKLFHDLVDPLQPNARPEVVHPVLERIIVHDQAPESVPGTP